MILWIYGLSASGKTTLAQQVMGVYPYYRIVHLDGDKLRATVNSDLDFTPKGRWENLRRAMGMAKMLDDQLFNVIATFITPYQEHRKMIKTYLGDQVKFIYLNCSLNECMKRDTKGLYERAILGEIERMTGISDRFDPPRDYDYIINTRKLSIDEMVDYFIENIVDELE